MATGSFFTETPMDRAFRRARWALAAAVSLGLADARGKLLAAEPVAPATHLFRSATTPLRHETGDPHVPEMQVELAWLADPVTFPYHLGARVEGGVLHVRGFVQTKAARERAVQIARSHCSLEVRDDLRIHPNMVAGGMALTTAPTQAEVAACLAEALPQLDTPPQVQCRPDGQIILSGFVGRLEDKVAVSQRLRRLPGCTAVLNQLELGATSPDTARISPEGGSEDSQKLPEGPSSASATATPAAHWQAATDATPPPVVVSPIVSGALVPDGKNTSSAAKVTEPATPPGAEVRVSPPKTRGLVPNTALLQRLTARVEVVCGGSASEVKLIPQTARDLRVQLKVRNDADGARLAEKVLQIPELASYHVDLDVRVDDSPAHSSASTARSAPPAIPSLPVVTTVPVAPPPSVPSFPVEVPTSPSVWSPAKDIRPVSLKELTPSRDKPPSDGVIFVPPVPPPTSPVAPPTAVSRPAAPPVDLNGELLEERVARLCGSRAADVQLTFSSPRSVQVAFTARSETDGEDLASKIMAMPDLSAYHVDLDVKVAGQPSPVVKTAPALPKTPDPVLPKTLGPFPVITQGPFASKPQTFELSDPSVPPAKVAPAEWHGAAVAALPVAANSKKGSPIAEQKAAPAKSASDAHVTTGTFVIDPPGPAVRQVSATSVTKPPEPARGTGSVESSGVVVVTESAAPAPAPPPMSLPALQNAIERVCGTRADVHLVSRSSGNLLVQFKARDADEAERLTNALLALPELIPYHVDVDVRLEH
jgi:hypothetical protein